MEDPYLNSTTIMFDSETGNLFTKKSINYGGRTVTSALYKCFRMGLGIVTVKPKVINQSSGDHVKVEGLR